QQPLLVELGQGRCPHVKAQMDSGRHFIDVLAARALGTDGMPFDLRFGDGHVVGDFQHGNGLSVCSGGGPATSDSGGLKAHSPANRLLRQPYRAVARNRSRALAKAWTWRLSS